MFANTEHQAPADFIAHSLQLARKRMGVFPDLAMINQAGNDLVDALESAEIPWEYNPWVLPIHVYFVGSVEE